MEESTSPQQVVRVVDVHPQTQSKPNDLERKNPMTTLTDKTIEQAPDHPLRTAVSKTGRFLLHLLEMLIAMQVGMMLFHLMLGLLRIFSISRAFESGTTVHAVTMTVFMAIPMAAWMIFRGHGWRHCIEMVIAMVVPVALIGLLCQLGIDAYLPWLAGLSAPLMFLGMILAMLYRRDHYTRTKGHVMEPATVQSEPSCH
jgi:hypothetical protein